MLIIEYAFHCQDIFNFKNIMLRRVKITEAESGAVIAEYPVILRSPEAHEKDFFDEAWVNAVENGLIRIDSKVNYKFLMAGEVSQE